MYIFPTINQCARTTLTARTVHNTYIRVYFKVAPDQYLYRYVCTSNIHLFRRRARLDDFKNVFPLLCDVCGTFVHAFTIIIIIIVQFCNV